MNPATLRFLVTTLAAALAMYLYSSSAQAGRIKVGTLAPRGSIYHQVLLDMGEAWRRAEGPEARFTVFTDGVQGGEADMVRRVRIGQLSAVMVSVIGLTEIDEGTAALQKMPLMFRSWEEVDAVGRRVRPLLERRMLEKGFVVLFWAEAGWVRFFSKTPAFVPEDFKRLKLFAWAGEPAQITLMKAMGYQPMVLETADILPGLQTGLINAVPVTAMWALASQIDASTGHMLNIRWVPIVGATVIARSAWDSLSPGGQAALRQASAEAAERLRQHRESIDEEAIAVMRERGLTVHELSPQAERAWRQLAESVYPKIRGTLVPADTFDAVRAALAEHRGTAVGALR